MASAKAWSQARKLFMRSDGVPLEQMPIIAARLASRSTVRAGCPIGPTAAWCALAVMVWGGIGGVGLPPCRA